jgi:hypothetical protein
MVFQIRLLTTEISYLKCNLEKGLVYWFNRLYYFSVTNDFEKKLNSHVLKKILILHFPKIVFSRVKLCFKISIMYVMLKVLYLFTFMTVLSHLHISKKIIALYIFNNYVKHK